MRSFHKQAVWIEWFENHAPVGVGFSSGFQPSALILLPRHSCQNSCSPLISHLLWVWFQWFQCKRPEFGSFHALLQVCSQRGLIHRSSTSNKKRTIAFMRPRLRPPKHTEAPHALHVLPSFSQSQWSVTNDGSHAHAAHSCRHNLTLDTSYPQFLAFYEKAVSLPTSVIRPRQLSSPLRSLITPSPPFSL